MKEHIYLKKIHKEIIYRNLNIVFFRVYFCLMCVNLFSLYYYYIQEEVKLKERNVEDEQFYIFIYKIKYATLNLFNQCAKLTVEIQNEDIFSLINDDEFTCFFMYSKFKNEIIKTNSKN